MASGRREESDSGVSEPERRPIHDALRESLADIEVIFAPTLPSFDKDKLQTATGKEKSVAEFLELYFPPGWEVRKGHIYDNHGNVSLEVDCALCVPQHPRCSTRKRNLILAEGVYVAVEVKPDIRSLGKEGEFARSLKQAATVKRLKRSINFGRPGPPESWPPEAHRIPYIVFAKQISDLEESAKFIDRQKEENSWCPWDLPDIVLGYQEGLIYHAAEASVCSISPIFANNGLESGEGYLLFPTGTDTLILFLALLYSFASPQPLVSTPILRDYLLPVAIPPGMKLLSVNP